MPRIKFITTGHSHLVGNFSAGEIFTGGDAECRHFVEDAHCAVWDEAGADATVQASGQAAPPAKPASTPRTPRTPRAAATPAAAPAVAPAAGDAAAVDPAAADATAETPAAP